MIKVNITKSSNYPVSAVALRRKLKSFLSSHGIVSEAEVAVALIGEKKMLEIGKKYLKDGKLHNVLSFVPDESKQKFVYPLDGIIHLGEIMVCYPVAYKEAKVEGKLIEEKVCELIEHGAMHLLGFTHGE